LNNPIMSDFSQDNCEFYFLQKTLNLVSQEKKDLIIDKIQEIAEEYFRKEKELEEKK